jgi:hypothetical protein
MTANELAPGDAVTILEPGSVYGAAAANTTVTYRVHQLDD